MQRFGYGRGRLDRVRDMTARAVANGNPALDYLGTGGGALLRVAA